MEDIPQNGLSNGLSALYESGDYSDLTVCSSRKEHKVHRAILCPQSRVFAVTCKGDFQESISKRIVLDEYDPDAVERMLYYLYNRDYDDGTPSCREEAVSGSEGTTERGDNQTGEVVQSAPEIVRTELRASEDLNENSEPAHASVMVKIPEAELVAAESGLLNNALVYDIADKHDILELKELAKTKFRAQAGSLTSSDEFPSVIKTVYSTTLGSDRGLRDIVSSTCAKEVRALRDNQVFKDTIEEIGAFGVDVLCKVLDNDDERLKQAQAEVAKLRGEKKRHLVDIHNLERERKQARDTLQAVTETVNHLEACTGCGAGFAARLRADHPTTVSCAKCRRTHW